MKLRCAIIDDEYLARQYIRDYVKRIPFLDLKGDFNSPLKAIEMIKSGEVDLIFLDIQMPDITGLDFLKILDNPPMVIFTTAYKEYAIEGYELNATDYLLKPFSFERFFQAVNKALEIHSNRDKSGFAEPSVTEQTQLLDQHIIVRADRKLYKINYEDLIYIEGQKAYVSFNTVERRITALAAMKVLEENLPAGQFIRIHKSYIVSVKKIESLEGNMIEIGGEKLPVGKSYRSRVDELFGL
jgi:DNA-binding LytR/AlgR family response regulator